MPLKKLFLRGAKCLCMERENILNRLSNLTMKNRDKLSRLESQDYGPAYKRAYNLEISRNIQTFSFFPRLQFNFQVNLI